MKRVQAMNTPFPISEFVSPCGCCMQKSIGFSLLTTHVLLFTFFFSLILMIYVYIYSSVWLMRWLLPRRRQHMQRNEAEQTNERKRINKFVLIFVVAMEMHEPWATSVLVLLLHSFYFRLGFDFVIHGTFFRRSTGKEWMNE